MIRAWGPISPSVAMILPGGSADLPTFLVITPISLSPTWRNELRAKKKKRTNNARSPATPRTAAAPGRSMVDLTAATTMATAKPKPTRMMIPLMALSFLFFANHLGVYAGGRCPSRLIAAPAGHVPRTPAILPAPDRSDPQPRRPPISRTEPRRARIMHGLRQRSPRGAIPGAIRLGSFEEIVRR